MTEEPVRLLTYRDVDAVVDYVTAVREELEAEHRRDDNYEYPFTPEYRAVQALELAIDCIRHVEGDRDAGRTDEAEEFAERVAALLAARGATVPAVDHGPPPTRRKIPKDEANVIVRDHLAGVFRRGGCMPTLRAMAEATGIPKSTIAETPAWQRVFERHRQLNPTARRPAPLTRKQLHVLEDEVATQEAEVARAIAEQNADAAADTRADRRL